MRKLNYTEGDRVVCVEETSGQGGVVNAGETGVANEIFRTSICPDCVDFKRDSDGSFAHVCASCFKKVAEEMCTKCAEESNTDIPKRACMVH